MMIFMDPPDHDVQRKLVSRAFTPRAIAELEPFVRTTAIECLEPLLREGRRRLRRGVLGDPPHERDHGAARRAAPPTATRSGTGWTRRSTGSRSRRTSPTTRSRPWRSPASTGPGSLADKRAHPDDGFISKLCAAEVRTTTARPTRLTDREVIGFASLIGSAGTETLTKLLANAVGAVPPQPGRVAEGARRPGEDPRRGRGDAALLGAVAVPGPGAHRRRHAARRRHAEGLTRAAAHRRREPRRAGVRRRPTGSTSTAPRTSRSDSATACTSASAPRSPGSRAASASRSSPRHFPTLRDRRGQRAARAHEQRARLRQRAVRRGLTAAQIRSPDGLRPSHGRSRPRSQP